MVQFNSQADLESFQRTLTRAMNGDQEAAHRVRTWFDIPKPRTPVYTGAGNECSEWCPEHGRRNR